MPPDSVRSRTGCATCRRRRKKKVPVLGSRSSQRDNTVSNCRCDERFDADRHPGACERCFKARLECDRSPIPRSRGKPRTKVAVGGSVIPPVSGSGTSSHSPRLPSPPLVTGLAASESSIDRVAPLDFDSLFHDFSQFLHAIPFSTEPSTGLLLASDMLDNMLTPGGAMVIPATSPNAMAPNGGACTADASPQMLNSSYFSSFPEPVRSRIASTITGTAAHNKLGQTASQAVILLYQAKAVIQDPHKRELLLAESHVRFEDALRYMVSPGIPLATRLTAVMDLQIYLFDRFGGAATHAVLSLGAFFVKSEPEPPLLVDFASLCTVSDVPFRIFVYAEDDFDGFKPGDPAFETHLGLPFGLLKSLAAVSALSAAAEGHNENLVLKKRNAIQTAIVHWRPSSPRHRNGLDSISALEEARIAEMWRQVAVLQLYQAVDKLRPDDALVIDAVRQVVLLGASSAPDESVGSARWSTMAGPFTLAAMMCILPEHQMACRDGLQRCGSQQGYLDNLAVAERVWQVRGVGGYGDWREILEEHELQLLFL